MDDSHSDVPEPTITWRVEHDPDDWSVYIDAINSYGNVDQEMICTIEQAHELAAILLRLSPGAAFP